MRNIDEDNNQSDAFIHSIALSANYETLYNAILRSIVAAKGELTILKKQKRKSKKDISYYKESLKFAGLIKFLLDFYGGWLGTLWI